MKRYFGHWQQRRFCFVGLSTFNHFHSARYCVNRKPPEKACWLCNRAHLCPTTHDQHITWVLNSERLKNYNQTFQRYRIIDC